MCNRLLQLKILVLLLLCSFYLNAQDSTEIINEVLEVQEQKIETVSPADEEENNIVSPAVQQQTEQNNNQNTRKNVKPEKINTTSVNKELEAARKNNPFGLIRNGKTKISKSISIFQTSATKQSLKTQELIPTEVDETPTIEEVFEPIDTSTIALNKANPFRLEGNQYDRQNMIKATKIKFNPNAGTGVINTKEKSTPLFDTSKVDVDANETLKFTLLTILLSVLAVIVSMFRSELTDIYQAFLSQNLMALLHRDKGTILRLPYLSMYVLTFLSIGTSIFLILNLLGIEIFKSQTKTVLACIMSIGGFYTLKHFILKLLSALFPFKKEAGLYSFTIAIFNFIIGIALLPFIALLAFADASLHNYVLYIMLALVGIILIYRIFRSLIISQKYLINNKFHFFMYLCTVEIAPMVILFKFIG